MQRILVALDVATAADADRHATTLAGAVGGLKIGGTPMVFETISPKMIAHSTYSIFGSVI